MILQIFSNTSSWYRLCMNNFFKLAFQSWNDALGYVACFQYFGVTLFEGVHFFVISFWCHWTTWVPARVVDETLGLETRCSPKSDETEAFADINRDETWRSSESDETRHELIRDVMKRDMSRYESLPKNSEELHQRPVCRKEHNEFSDI